MSTEIAQKLADLAEEETLALVRQKLDAGEDPLVILEACREGMNLVGKRYEESEYFISDLMMAGMIFKEVTEVLGSKLLPGAEVKSGKVVIGTVQGDIHDIGKDLVVSMLKANGFEVFDMGVDVAPDKFLAKVKETGATVLGLSGLLTVSYDGMREIINQLGKAGLRPKVKVMIGGGPIDEHVREYVGADAFGTSAQTAVHLASEWTREG
jgi:methanogenic corrinoid protein MtbC1